MPISPRLKKTCEAPNASSTSRSRCSSRNGRREVDERREEQHAQRDPDVRRVELAAERALVAARHRPRHLVARPLLEHRAAAVVDLHLGDLVARRRSSSPASARALACTRSGASGAVAARSAATLSARVGDRASTSCALRSEKRGGSVCDGGTRRSGAAGGAPAQPASSAARTAASAALSRARSSIAKLHILFPMKLSGVAATIEIACAGISATPATLTSSSSTSSANRNATTLTVKKRAAWKPACPPARPEGPVAVPPEVVHHRDHERGRGGGQVVQAEQLHAEREDGQVDDVARAADGAELDELDPVVGPAQPRADADVHAVWALGDGGLASSVIGRGYTEVLEHQRRHVGERPLLALGRVDPAHEQHALRVVAVQRAVAAAAHVVGAAPVDELVAAARPTPARPPRAGTSSADHSRPSASGYVVARHAAVGHAQVERRPARRRRSSAPPRGSASSPPGAKRSSPRSERTTALALRRGR